MSVNLSAARCLGRHELFESTDLRDHWAAAAICSTCPAITACAAELQSVLATGRALRGHGGGPVGTWAGQLVGVSPKPRRGKPRPREHGTDRGYHQHRQALETACEDCKAAHRAAWHARKVAS